MIVTSAGASPGLAEATKASRGRLHSALPISALSTGLWVENVPQGITEEVEAEHAQADRDTFDLLGKDGHSRVALSVRSDDEPTLEFLDKDGVKRVLLGRGELKTLGSGEIKQLPMSSLVLRGEDGKILWKMP